MKRVLVVAAHPDDEVLGCGGAIARHVAAGDHVDILILAEGVTSRDESRDPDARREDVDDLRAAALDAANALGANTVVFGGLPDNRMDRVELLDVVKLVERELQRLAPQIVYTHHMYDLNIDHQITSRAVMTACRPLPASSRTTILHFETVSSTEWQPWGAAGGFTPNWFVDITDVLEAKMQALQRYQSEVRESPRARSFETIRALAALRGATAGCSFAEAFMLARHIEGGLPPDG
ncbi:MAG: PIG-L family deacetylase [Coriobacteriia bacterium]